MAQENLNVARREYQDTETHVRNLENAANRAKQAVTRHDREARDLRTEKQRLEDRVEELQGDLDRDTVNDTSALDELYSQLAEAQEALRASEANMQDAINAMERVHENQRDVKQALDAATRELEEALAQINKAKRKLEEKDNERHFALRKKNEALEMVEHARQQREVLDEKRAEQAKTVEEWTVQAELVCRRVNVEYSVTVLDKKLERLQQERQAFERQFVQLKG